MSIDQLNNGGAERSRGHPDGLGAQEGGAYTSRFDVEEASTDAAYNSKSQYGRITEINLTRQLMRFFEAYLVGIASILTVEYWHNITRAIHLLLDAVPFP